MAASHTVTVLLDDLIVLTRGYLSGLGRVAGDVAVDGSPDLPVRRRVRLIRERDGICVGEAWSDPVTGAYDFPGVNPNERYTVIAYDGPRVYTAAVQDNVQPTAYP